jgi:hypothetical protein
MSEHIKELSDDVEKIFVLGALFFLITNLFAHLKYFILSFIIHTYRVSQKWRTNYLLPYPACLNVHEKNMEKIFQTKK